MKTILITGFDPFGGEPINPAWEAVKTMDGYTDGDYKVVTQWCQLYVILLLIL